MIFSSTGDKRVITMRSHEYKYIHINTGHEVKYKQHGIIVL